MKKTILNISIVLVAIVLAGAGCASQMDGTESPDGANNQAVVQPDGQNLNGETQTSIRLAQNERVGQYFTDSAGMALYIFTRDTGEGSVCEGQCLIAWPIFYAENLTVPDGLDPADFGEITHPNGEPMTTYKGWPLYYYQGDANPGDITGEGVGNVWYVAKSDYGILFATGADGNYLVDDRGMTLYYFTRDAADTSACVGQCLIAWPPFYSESRVVPTTVTNPDDFDDFERSSGREQTTFKDWPLYYFEEDQKRGDTLGEGVGEVWFTINPEDLGAAPAATTTQ